MLAPLYTAVLVVGLGHHAPRVGCCDVCGVENAAVAAEIGQLQTCPRWRDRDRAARVLRRVDWRCHPEVVDALAFSLLHDCDEEVREEAAESLAKMRPCLPSAHRALTTAASCDPDHSTRHWAKKALANLGARCTGSCTVCGPAAVVVPGAVVTPLPAPIIEEPVLSPLTPTTLLVPDPAGSSASSPFAPLPPGSAESRLPSAETLSPLPPLTPPAVAPAPEAAPAPAPLNELHLDAPADLPAEAPRSSPFSAARPAPGSGPGRSIAAREPAPARRLPAPAPAPFRPLRRVLRMIPGPNYAGALLGRRVAEDRDLARAPIGRSARGESDRQDVASNSGTPR